MADEMMLIVCRRCRKGIIFMAALGSLIGSRGTIEGAESFIVHHYQECWSGMPVLLPIAFEFGSEADLGHGVELESPRAKSIQS